MNRKSDLQDLVARIGRTGHLQAESLSVPVTILDVQVAWGKARYHVTPVGGSGEQWVEARRVTLTDLTS